MDFNFDEIIDEGPVEGKISFITSIDNPIKGNIEQEVSPDNLIPVLPLRGVMLFPETMVPISIGRDSSLKLLKEAQKKDMAIAVFTQVDDSTDEPDYDQLYHTGVIGKVQKIIKLPDGSRTALIQGYTRVKLIEMEWKNQKSQSCKAWHESNHHLYAGWCDRQKDGEGHQRSKDLSQ